ncbi:MAG: hypothetical protein R3257_06760, partial [bacterium]|nr:hypothetical protein [bacterium]
MKFFITPLFLIGILILFPGQLWSQASVNVNNLDPAYRDIGKLVGHGLIDRIIMGQRPWSRREFGRLTGEAMRNLPRIEKQLHDPDISEKKKAKLRRRLEYVNTILKRLKRRFHEELIQLGYVKGDSKWYSVHLLDHADANLNINNSLPRTIPPNGLGTADALINPLLQYQQGRHIIDGSNLSLETVTWLRAS